jgi:uncharacterized protein YjbJ (UPF0337 family)
MERKILQNNWVEMRGQISEWWDELTDKDLDRINGNPDQLITILQERYGYTRSLAFLEVEIRMASYPPEDEERKNRSNRAVRVSQYSYYDDDWSEINKGRGFSKSSVKVHNQGFADL